MHPTLRQLSRPIALAVVAVLAAGCAGRSLRDTVDTPGDTETTVIESPVPGEADLPNDPTEDGVEPESEDELGTEDGEQ